MVNDTDICACGHYRLQHTPGCQMCEYLGDGTAVRCKEFRSLFAIEEIAQKTEAKPQAMSSPKPKAHPHDDYVRQIVDLAHLTGWKVVYWRAARTANGWATPVGGDGKDFPDLFLCKLTHPREEGGVLVAYFWEVKVGKDRVRPGQQAWLDLLGGRVIRPSDWPWVVETLKGER